MKKKKESTDLSLFVKRIEVKRKRDFIILRTSSSLFPVLFLEQGDRESVNRMPKTSSCERDSETGLGKRTEMKKKRIEKKSSNELVRSHTSSFSLLRTKQQSSARKRMAKREVRAIIEVLVKEEAEEGKRLECENQVSKEKEQKNSVKRRMERSSGSSTKRKKKSAPKGHARYLKNSGPDFGTES